VNLVGETESQDLLDARCKDLLFESSLWAGWFLPLAAVPGTRVAEELLLLMFGRGIFSLAVPRRWCKAEFLL